MSWPADRVAELGRLLGEGWKFSDCAEHFGVTMHEIVTAKQTHFALLNLKSRRPQCGQHRRSA